MFGCRWACDASEQDKIRYVDWVHARLHDLRVNPRYAQYRDAGPLTHPETQVHGVLAMMIRPCKPRDSARPALLTAVRNRRSGLALHPPKENYTALQPLTGAAEYAWGARAG